MGDLLRVIQARTSETLRKDHGSGKDRSGKAAATGFIAAGFKTSLLQIWFQFTHQSKISVFRPIMPELHADDLDFDSSVLTPAQRSEVCTYRLGTPESGRA